MMRMILLLAIAVLMTACARNATISKFVDPLAEFHLVDIDGVAFPATAMISFPEKGRVIGQAPCNRYFATQTVPYPWFGLEGIGATRMACPDLASESAFFAALGEMTLAEVSNDTLILSNSVGSEMVFAAR